METTYKDTNRGFSGTNGVELYEKSFAKDEFDIQAVKVQLESSTATARVMNIALKMLTMDWTDQTINDVEEMIDARVKELALGVDYKVTGVNAKERTHTMYVRANDIHRAKKIFEAKMSNSSYGPYIAQKVEKFVPEN